MTAPPSRRAGTCGREAGPEAVDRPGVAYGLGGFDLAVVATGGALVLAFAPWLIFDAWTPRMAIVVAWTPIGVALLVDGARGGDRASRLMLLALVALAVSSLLSDDPWGSAVGVVGRDLSALTFVGCAGLWAAARRLSASGRSVLMTVVVWAATGSATVGALQVAFDVQNGSLALFGRRPSGLAVNPVFFGAVSAGAAVMAMVSLVGTRHRRRPGLYGALIALALGVSISGSRVALAITAVLAVLLVVHRRSVVALQTVAVLMGGLVGGVVFDRFVGGGTNAADRLVVGGGGGRATVWGYALDALMDRPVLGHGIGRFRESVQAEFSVDFVASAAADDLRQAWFDPHNAGLLLLVAGGVVGTGLIVAWLVVAVRGSAGPTAWGAAALALTWVVQPVALATFPLAMLLLGAAAPAVAGTDAREAGPVVVPKALTGSRPVAAGLAIVGVVAAGYLFVADVVLDRAADRLDPGLAETAAALYVHDPTVGDVVAQIHEFDGDLAAALEWRETTAEWGPRRPYWWSRLADVAILNGDLASADAALATAFRLQPNNVRTSRVDARLAIRLADEKRLAAALDRLCALGQQVECDLDPAALIDAAADR